MSRLFEDYLTDEERQAIDRLLSTREVRFDKLIELAGMDPKEDLRHSNLRGVNFCGANLRGFDLTGCDLRNAIRNKSTTIDETTILTGALVRWVDEEDIPIVEMMHSVQAASGSNERIERLGNLQRQFGRTHHVLEFVVNIAVEARDIEVYLDFLEFLPRDLSGPLANRLIDAGVKLIERKLAQTRQRTRRKTTTIFAIGPIYNRLQQAENSFALKWFVKLADLVAREEQAHGDRPVYDVEAQVLIQALKELK